jgi:hypothetical protein
VFPLLLALDTWMLMIGHAGRYGVAGFNVAHFALLDALLPTPVAGLYVGVLVLTGLLSLVVMLTGVRRGSGLLLFALYTLSWSMSMLDSYQHHYLLSLLLLCFAFFPEDVTAARLHPQPPPPPAPGEKAKPQQKRELERAGSEESAGWVYCAAMLLIGGGYALIDHGEHIWVAFFSLACLVGVATVFYTPKRELLLRSGFGFNLLGAAVCIVYLYTAIAKMDANWVEGHTLLRISSVEREFAGLAELGQRLGIERERFWSLFATFVIPQELFVGAAYLLAVVRDRAPRPWLSALCSLAFALSIALHVGADAMGLEIGWFSAYMLLLACCYLLPLAAVDRLNTVFTWPARRVARLAGDFGNAARVPRGESLGFALGGGALLVLIGQLLDLPGAVAACAVASVVLCAVAFWGVRRGRDPRRLIASSVVAGAAMWLAIAASPVRWDFYRYLGGDLMRRDEPEGALEAYLRGERYAPPGKSRADKIKQLRERLGQ